MPLSAADLAEYRPLRRRANLARGALIAFILVGLVAIGSTQAEYELLERIEAGEFVSDDELTRNDNRQLAIGIFQFLILVACVVFFLMWFSRAYRNITALGADSRRYSQGWSVGSWFVPILNLFRPKQIANDIWRGSDPDLRLERQGDWHSGSVHWLLTLWWAAFIISGWVSNVVLRRTFTEDDTIEELKTLDSFYIVSDSLDVITAVLAIVVITMMTRRQEARHARAVAAVEQEPQQPAEADAGLPFRSGY